MGSSSLSVGAASDTPAALLLAGRYDVADVLGMRLHMLLEVMVASSATHNTDGMADGVERSAGSNGSLSQAQAHLPIMRRTGTLRNLTSFTSFSVGAARARRASAVSNSTGSEELVQRWGWVTNSSSSSSSKFVYTHQHAIARHGACSFIW